MLEEHVIQWIKNLKPRVMQYLFYQDAVEETYEILDQMQSREKIEYEIKLVGDFFASEFYNADFDPWPDLETRIDTIEDLKKLIENDLDQKRFENGIAYIFTKEDAGRSPEPEVDPQKDAFFSMMTDAFDVNEFYNYLEKSKTEVTEILEKGPENESEGAEKPEQPSDDLYDSEGADLLKARLADILDGHLDSF